MWGEISSSSWGKERIRDKVTPPDKEVWAPNAMRGTNERNTQGTKERMGGEPQAQENRLKMTQTKTLELRIEFLVDAISKCHMAVATRKRWKEIEASMDAVEIAWDKIRRTSSESVSRAGLNLDHLQFGQSSRSKKLRSLFHGHFWTKT